MSKYVAVVESKKVSNVYFSQKSGKESTNLQMTDVFIKFLKVNYLVALVLTKVYLRKTKTNEFSV